MGDTKIVKGKSDFLFAPPSLIEGMARLVDFGGTLTEFNRSPNPDHLAIAGDWRAVGHDLASAFRRSLLRALSLTPR